MDGKPLCDSSPTYVVESKALEEPVSPGSKLPTTELVLSDFGAGIITIKSLDVG